LHPAIDLALFKDARVVAPAKPSRFSVGVTRCESEPARGTFDSNLRMSGPARVCPRARLPPQSEEAVTTILPSSCGRSRARRSIAGSAIICASIALAAFPRPAIPQVLDQEGRDVPVAPGDTIADRRSLAAAVGEGEEGVPGTRNRELYQISAVRVEQGPVIDGILDDDVWQQAPIIGSFTQQEPIEGAPASEATEVRVLYDGANLFVGVRALDSSPDRIVATEMRRDGNQILNEDNFQIILDTFMDSRSAYMFVVSPLGAMLDQQVFEEGEGGRGGAGGNVNRDWDGVWEAAARRTHEGWTAEIRIPMVTLRFPAADQQAWGINFMRNIAHRNEVAFWAPIPKPYGLTRVSQAGALVGLEALNRGRDLRFKPYVTAGGRSELNEGITDRSGQGDFGLDVRYGLTASLNLDLTFNTDFAQAEADDERVNLTRFALFFPEKRDFFLENAGQFNVGSASSLGRIADLFFSRRIGITDSGDQVPILAGARLTGKVGQNNIAAMTIQTDDAFDQPGENFLVTRYYRDVLGRSRVGAIAINRQAMEDGHYNRTVAADANFALGSSVAIEGFLARTFSPGIRSDDVGAHFRAAYLDRSWRLYLEYTDLQDNFNPEVGFVPRTGIRRSKLHFERNPRPGRWGIRVLEPMWNVTYVTDQTGRLVSRQYHSMLGIRFLNGAYLNFWNNRYFERIDRAFRVGGVSIPAGDYLFQDWRASFNSNPARRVNFSASYEPQTFYDGDRTDISLGVGSRITSQLSASARYSRNDLDLPNGSFVAEVGSLQVDYAHSPTLSLRTLTQYNSANEQWSTGARLRYNYRPGSDLYIVYDELRRDIDGVPVVQEFRDRQLIVKMTYLFSL
jgi:hypothetical protein